jgi:hypothetical protein
MKTLNTKKSLMHFGFFSLVILLLVSCSVEHCYNFTFTTVTRSTNGSNASSTQSSTIYCGITKGEANTMADSMKDSVRSGGYIIITTVTFKEQ